MFAPKVKMTREGQPCRKCGTPVVYKRARPKRRYSPEQTYDAFGAWLWCPRCKTAYMLPESIVPIENGKRADTIDCDRPLFAGMEIS